MHDLLRGSDEAMSVAQIVSATGLHANTVRAHLALLQDMGQVESVPERRATPGRPRLLYRASAGPVEDPYRVLAAELAAATAATSEERSGDTPGVAAGRRLARAQRRKADAPGEVDPERSVAMAVEGLDVLGFETTTDPLGDRLYLSVCPFLEMAKEDRAICRLHREMLDGFFSELGSGVSVRRLDIFVKGDLCVAHLARPDLRPAPAPLRTSEDEETS
ncbi:MAG: helix-turn-helix domain-containing protein [Frankiales bacterium]|nr:helix-turn-helix domain-containing protein [Frankiales bacterium]